FEPHGTATVGWASQVREYMETRLPSLLGLSNYTFVNPYGVACPKMGPQFVSDEFFSQECPEGGLCMAWTSLYAHLRLRFMDIPDTTILEVLLRYSGRGLTNLIRRYIG